VSAGGETVPVSGRERILVIKLGALGDFVLAMGPAASIRAHHPHAEITLLTAPAFADLAKAAPYFDRVWLDDRPGWARPWALWRLRRKISRAGFTRVYDLQTSDRSGLYFHLLWPSRPQWSGIASGSSHPHANPDRNSMHTIDRQAEQLRMAGIERVPAPDLSWATGDVQRFNLPKKFLLLVPGGAPHRPAKRWPAGRFAQIANLAARRGVTPVVLGGPAERAIGASILNTVPQARDLTGKTSFGDIVALGRLALHALGNDTGPMHLVVASGCPATVLYSHESDPGLTAPRGPRVTILRRPDLAQLSVEDVAATLPLG
jgi:ADP-heptose:LPS heptosyltransferase